MAKKGKERKIHVARTPKEVAVYKERYLKHLSTGFAPGLAAEKANVTRATVYGWRSDDEQFAKDWDDAIETGVDKIEAALAKRAREHSDRAAIAILAAYRPERYARQANADAHTSVTFQVTMQDHAKRLERLGLPSPVIEVDSNENPDAPAPINAIIESD